MIRTRNQCRLNSNRSSSPQSHMRWTTSILPICCSALPCNQPWFEQNQQKRTPSSSSFFFTIILSFIPVPSLPKPSPLSQKAKLQTTYSAQPIIFKIFFPYTEVPEEALRFCILESISMCFLPSRWISISFRFRVASYLLQKPCCLLHTKVKNKKNWRFEQANQ